MTPTSRGTRVQVIVGETDHHGRVPRYQAMLEYLRKEGAAGATIVRGIAGFGANSRIHTAAVLRLSLDLPVILTWIDDPARVERLLPRLRELAGSGIVTIEEVGIAGYGVRGVAQLRFDLPVQDVMTRPPFSVTIETPIRDVAALLLRQDFRAVPVVDDAGRLVGMLSSGDLVERAGLRARLELLRAMPDATAATFLEELPARTAAEVMTAPVISVRETATLASAAHRMAAEGIKRVPVVDAGGRLVGILSRADVLRAAGESFPRDGATEAPAAARTVGELMRTDAPTVARDADLGDVLDAVISTRLNRAIVLDPERRVLGVVTDADILRLVDPEASGGLVGSLMRTVTRPPRGTASSGDLVLRPALTAPADTSIAAAARMMIERQVKILSVVDDGGRLLGIVDRADLLRAVGEAARDLGSGAADDDAED